MLFEIKTMIDSFMYFGLSGWIVLVGVKRKLD